MQRTLVIFFLLILPLPLVAQTADFYIQTEYRDDSIDYSGSTLYYNRDKISIFFSQESTFNAAYIYIEKYDASKFTWNLFLKDISPYFVFLFGNYFVNYGSGLLVGRKNFFNADIFDYKKPDRQSNAFRPCNTGDPVFAFNGAAVSYRNQFAKCVLSFDSFWSAKERFVNQSDYNGQSYSGSLTTLDTKISRQYNQTDPVSIVTGGSMLSLGFMNHFLFQLYSIIANIQTPGTGQNEILWDYYNQAGAEYGVSKFCGGGFFGQYKDDYLDIVYDISVTKKYIIENNIKDTVTGAGFLYSIKFAPPYVELSVTGKEMDNNYYSPYTSTIGDDYPEDAYFLQCEAKPYRNFHLGSSVSSQKNLHPGSGDKGIDITEKEKLYVTYYYRIIKELNISVSQAEYKDVNSKKNQLKGNTTVEINKYIDIKCKAIYQNTDSEEKSWLAGCGIDLSLLTYFGFDLNYLYAEISKENPLYIIASPLRNAGIPGIFIRQSSNIIITKFDFKYMQISLNLRYIDQFISGHNLDRRLEFAGSAYY